MVGGLTGLILVVLIVYTTMIYCQLMTGKRFKSKNLFSHTDCCSVCCIGAAVGILRCCCSCDPKVMKELNDQDGDSIVNQDAAQVFMKSQAMQAGGGGAPTSNYMVMHT